MTRRGKIAVGIGGIGVVVVVVVGWFLISPLFIDEVVDEAFPGPEALAAMSDEEKEKMRDAVMEAARSAPDKEMTEAMPEEGAGPVQLSTGSFKDADSIHKGAGTATLYRLADGQYVLRLEGFEVTNGPDLRVLASAHPVLGIGSGRDGNEDPQVVELPGEFGLKAAAGQQVKKYDREFRPGRFVRCVVHGGSPLAVGFSNPTALILADRRGAFSVGRLSLYGPDEAHILVARRRKALPITETELRLMAAAAIIGLKRRPRKG